MNALVLTLKLETPLLVTDIGRGEENSARGLPYLPGSAIRGAAIACYRSQHGRGDLLADANAVRLFFSGAVRYLHAYPLCRGTRALPTPASWFCEKNADLTQKPPAYDLGAARAHSLVHPEAVDKPFCRLDGNMAEVFAPHFEASVHIGGEERRRVEEGKNQVFHYQSLAAGQDFQAAILADDAKDLNTLKTLLPKGGLLRLGRSRTARYGLVRIENILEKRDWQESASRELEEITTITLLSDALLRDVDGQPAADLDAVLANRLGKPGLKHKAAFARTILVGGFNRKWGLPLPQSPALAAGSMLVYAAKDLGLDELDELVEQGVGERRTEGFGRLAVNWPGVDSFHLQPPLEERPLAVDLPLSPASQELAGRMARQMLRSRLDEALQEKAQRVTLEKRPPNHQLSRLRNVVRKALWSQDKDPGPILDYFAEDHMRQAARKQFYQARLNNARLELWIKERAEKVDGIQELGWQPHMAPNVAGQTALVECGEEKDFEMDMKREYTLRLIDAVLRQAMVNNRRADNLQEVQE